MSKQFATVEKGGRRRRLTICGNARYDMIVTCPTLFVLIDARVSDGKGQVKPSRDNGAATVKYKGEDSAMLPMPA